MNDIATSDGRCRSGVFLDLDSIHPGDLDMQPLHDSLPVWQFHGYSETGVIRERIRDAAVVVSNKAPLDRITLETAPGVKLICVAATGTNNVDLEAARDLGITVCNARDYATASVVEHVFSMLLSLNRQLDAYRSRVNRGDWSGSRDFCLFDASIEELADKTIGIIGYGVLGQAVARIARAFSMHVQIAQRSYSRAAPGRVTLTELLQTSDIISLHCPLTQTNRNLLGKREFELMKNTAIVINTARGGLIDETALVEALQQERIAAAAIDVLEQEPPASTNPLLNYKSEKLIVTPHVAWASRAARQRLVGEIAHNIEAFRQGSVRNRV